MQAHLAFVLSSPLWSSCAFNCDLLELIPGFYQRTNDSFHNPFELRRMKWNKYRNQLYYVPWEHCCFFCSIRLHAAVKREQGKLVFGYINPFQLYKWHRRSKTTKKELNRSDKSHDSIATARRFFQWWKMRLATHTLY